MLLKCEKCFVKITKNSPTLTCSECLKTKHPKCQKISKQEARHIINLQLKWTCFDCIKEILPIDACQSPKIFKPRPEFKVKCYCCNGYCYSPSSLKICDWCDNNVHAKCLKGVLGCIKCCIDIIPGALVTTYDLYDNYCSLDKFIHNPYNRENFTNLIGNMIENNVQNDSTWSEISDLLIKCKYQQLRNIQPPFQSTLKVFSLNIRSLVKNIHKLREEITTFEKFDVLAFNETNCTLDKLPHGINDLLLEGFHEPIIQAPLRKSGKGGGLVTYINTRVCDSDKIEKFSANPDPDDTSVELQFLKLHNCKGYNSTKIIVNVYRSPSRSAESCIRLLDLINRNLNRHSKKHIIFVGDLNCDLLKHNSNIQYQNLINMMAQYGFVQTVSRPTRITDYSATLIDHVYTNNLDSMLSCNIITTDISDHLGTSTTIALDKGLGTRIALNIRNQNPAIKEYRIFNEASNQKFKELINEESWEEVFSEADIDIQYETFNKIYTRHYDTAYPCIKNRARRKNERKNPKPWILPWLEDAIARKQGLYFLSSKTPTAENRAEYKKLEKFCDKHVDIAKKKYYKKFFDEHKDNSKKQWEMINSLLNRNKNNKQPASIKLHNSEGNSISDPTKVATMFNQYFSNIASNLKSNVNTRLTFDPGGFLVNSSPYSMHVNQVDNSEVYEIVKSLKNKSTLDSKISALKIANSVYSFTDTLAKMINKSFDEGKFPKMLKTARVVPIHKEGSKTDVANYRPISLLSSFSKIYEKLMHKRLLTFLDHNEVLFENQYGFRPGRSCEHALLNAQNTILNSLNKNEVALLLLIDFSKAFDMVDHDILLNKLYHYGVRGIAHKWFKSYLENRKQFVSIEGHNSSHETQQYGVPQGSILGPLLFIIYINDFPGVSKLAKFIMYADDANIIITGMSVDEVYQKLFNLSSEILNWVNSNGLAINLKKTKYMVFARNQTIPNHEYKLANVLIERKTEARFLGVIIDEKLTWAKHIETVKSKMARYLGVMYRIRTRIPIQPRLQIFHSFVQSHLNFCSIVWGFAAKSHIDSIFRKQKSGIRAAMGGYINYKYHDGEMPTHTKSTFFLHQILTIQSIIVKNALLFMHKIQHFPNLLPQSIVETIPENVPKFGSTHETSYDWLKTYELTGHLYRRSIFNKGPLLSITTENESIQSPAGLLSINLYKNNVKSLMLKLQNLGTEDEWPSFLLHNIPGLRKSDRLTKLT